MAAEKTADRRPPEVVDRLFVGISGAIWLVLLVVGVIATIALVGLGRGTAGEEERHSSWVLYTVIAVSSVTLAAAIPLLIRARRNALAAPEARPGSDAPSAAPAAPAAAAASSGGPVPAVPVDPPTEKLRVFGSLVERVERGDRGAAPAGESRPHAAAARAPRVERLLLRCASSIFAAMGLALIGVATATYLLAVGSDTAAWVALGFAAVITIGMPAAAVFFQRQLDTGEEPGAATA